jgi:Kef-type K+ transport system membrane component KefB
VVVLSAGVGNDVVGWILLALAIALVNAASGIVVLYVLLTTVGWILVLWFVGRPLLKLVGRKTRSFGEHGPSQTMTAFVLFLVLASAWLTDRIGMCVSLPLCLFLEEEEKLTDRTENSHAIFGAFLVGLIVPKEIRGSLTEKIEDLVTVLLLPLYFALSYVSSSSPTLLSPPSLSGPGPISVEDLERRLTISSTPSPLPPSSSREKTAVSKRTSASSATVRSGAT